MSFTNKVALVTASTRGIGLAIVQALAAQGTTVYMAARRVDFAESLAAEMNAKGQSVKTVYFDAYDPACYSQMVDTIVSAEGRLDILVNNFGTSDPKTDKTIADTNYKDFQKVVDVNLQSVFRASQAVLPIMAKNGGGVIINISSVGGSVPDISQIAYGTSKAAINYLTKLIAVQQARNNIRCNAVLPGMTATDAVKDALSDEFKSFFLKHIPLHRVGTPEEVAAAVVYFASDEASYVTGQILDVSGGFGLATPIYGDMADSQVKR